MISALYPESVAVIGGGRWARVLTEVLCDLVPPSVGISVHSLHNANAMLIWAKSRGFAQRIQISSDWPKFHSGSVNAAIVANAARDHEKAVEWALSAGVPVLVEKPITVTAATSQRLVDMAKIRNIRFAAAHVFLFAKYFENFSKFVFESGNIRRLRVHWIDPRLEERYGERKQFDPTLPIFTDCLPHVLSMIGVLVPNLPQKCENLKFLRGGARLELELSVGDIPCNVQLERNSDKRQRTIEVDTTQQILKLDFSKEPGIIVSGSETIDADPDWMLKKRPLTRMLTAFLQWAAGGEFDSRLDIEIGLRANRVIDQVSDLY